MPWEAMSFDSSAVSSSFLYTNVSPAYPAINRGIWKTIEEFERRFVSRHDTLVVIPAMGGKWIRFAGYWGDLPHEFIAPRKYFKILLSPRKRRQLDFLFLISLAVFLMTLIPRLSLCQLTISNATLEWVVSSNDTRGASLVG